MLTLGYKICAIVINQNSEPAQLDQKGGEINLVSLLNLEFFIKFDSLLT